MEGADSGVVLCATLGLVAIFGTVLSVSVRGGGLFRSKMRLEEVALFSGTYSSWKPKECGVGEVLEGDKVALDETLEVILTLVALWESRFAMQAKQTSKQQQSYKR